MNAPYRLWHGREDPPPERLPVTVGSLTADLLGPDVRYLRRGSSELVRRIHVAVRDASWGTVPAMISEEQLEVGPAGFRLSFCASHQRSDLSFSWTGSVEGAPDGSLRYGMTGIAESTFAYRRIGICVLLGPEDHAGRAFRGTSASGDISGRLPLLVAPQALEGDRFVALFPPVDELDISLAAGRLRIGVAGGPLEMEDQRNWTDASFKLYPAKPPTRRDPWTMFEGTRVEQSVVVRLHGDSSGSRAGAGAPRVRVRPVASGPRPKIGLGHAAGPLTPRERSLLGALRPAHLRCDLSLGTPSWPAVLREAAAVGTALGTQLELALHVGPDHEPQLRALAEQLRRATRVARVLTFREDSEPTPPGDVRRTERLVAPGARKARFGGGSDVAFAEVNRLRAPAGVLAYAVTPQVHAEDDLSLVEAAAAQADTVRTARAFAGPIPIAVTPITLRMRFNPDAAAGEARGDGLADRADPRQASLLGAAWTVASLAALCVGGADSITYYETVGPTGLVERASPPLPDFPSAPGMVFPLYHVLRAAMELPRPDFHACDVDQPLAVAALALSTTVVTRVLVANLTSGAQEARVEGLAGVAARLRLLDDRTATAGPAGLAAATVRVRALGGAYRVPLRPFACAILDVAGPMPTR